MTKIMNENSIYRPLIVIIVVAALFALVFVATLNHFISKNRNYWNEIETRSQTHKTLTTAYLDCRGKFFRDTREACILLAKDYADLVGIDDAVARETLLEIKSASDNLKSM